MKNELTAPDNAMPVATMPPTVYNKIASSQMSNIFQNTEIMNTIYATARILAKSPVLPKEYQDEGSCFIICELAARTGLATMMVAQNLIVVNGRPSWSGQACIALINQSRRYDRPLKIRFVDKAGNDMPRYIQGETTGAYAYATQGGEEFFGTTVTWEIVQSEGWNRDKGSMKSKWQTMPEQMFKYRAASFFAKEHCPDLLFGCSVEGEAEDIAANAPEVKVQADMETAKNVLEGLGGEVEQTGLKL